MIDRNNVAREKLARAVELMRQSDIGMWVFYSRLKQDPALELMFNTDTREEVLMALTASGACYAFVPAACSAQFLASGLYNDVIVTDSRQIMPEIGRASCRERV